MVQGGALAAAVLLAGCASLPDSIDPIVWWHDLQGGAIARQRPPPPRADEPFPNLASVPAAPAAITPAARAQVDARLAADRGSAQYGASLVPLAAPAPPVLAPVAPPSATPTAATPVGASAAFPAVTSPASAAASAAPPPVAAAAPTAAPIAPPPLSAAPPRPPDLPGVPAVTRPTPPRPTPPAAPARVVVPDLPPVLVAFPGGSAILSSGERAALKPIVRGRAGARIAVTGFGEADGADAESQQAGLALGLARARTVAAALAADGVPAAALRVAAVAAGRGASARLVE